MQKLKLEHYVIFIILALLVIGFIYVRGSEKDIKKNGVLITTKIVEYLPPGKSMNYANYSCEFSYNGQLKRLTSKSRIQYNRTSFIGSYFPAMYSAKSDAIRILMKPEDFEEFGIPYPDSLLNQVIDLSQ